MNDNWRDAKKVLCLRLDNMGDVLMCSPAMRALKDSCPGRSLTLLCSPEGACLARLIPEVDAILECRVPWMKNGDGVTASGIEHLAGRLRDQAFDGAVIFTTYTQSPLPAALLCYMAGIPRRLAFCHENPYDLLTDWVPDPEPGSLVRHEVERQLALVSSIQARTADTRLSLQLKAHDLERSRRLLKDADLKTDEPWIVLHPGATAPSRRYPPEHFARVVRELVMDHGVQVVMTGSREDTRLINDIRILSQAPAASLAGQTDVAALAGVISQAPLVLCNNSASAHIAAALGTTVVVLYALTNLQHTPWKVKSRVLSHDVPCKSCYKSICPLGHHDCLRKVSPQEVVEAVLSLLKTSEQLVEGRSL